MSGRVLDQNAVEWPPDVVLAESQAGKPRGFADDVGDFRETGKQQVDLTMPSFQEAQRLAPLSMSAINSRYYEGMARRRQEEWAEAVRIFEELLETFPEAIGAPEALYHLGDSRLRAGDRAGGVEAGEEARRRFPEDAWGERAGERLEEPEGGRESPPPSL